MSSRRNVLRVAAALAVASPGCLAAAPTSNPGGFGGAEVEPAVDEPVRGLADPIEVSGAPDASAGSEAVADALADRRADGAGVNVAVVSGLDADRAVVVSRRTLLNRRGRVIRDPAVGFAELRGATPSAVLSTGPSADRDGASETPVYVRDEVLREE